MRAPKRRKQDTGLETELAEPTERWWRALPLRRRVLESLAEAFGGVVASSKRCSKTRRTGWTRRPVRGSKARSGAYRGGAKPSSPGSPCWAGLGAKAIRSSLTGWPSIASTGGSLTSQSTALARSDEAACRRARARGRRARDVCDFPPRRRGLVCRGGTHGSASLAASRRPFRGGEPVRLCGMLGGADRHRRESGRHGLPRGRLRAPDRSRAGRHARTVHGDPAAEGGARGIADRLARAGLPLLAQHVDPIDAGRSWTSFATIHAPRCLGPTHCAMASTFRRLLRLVVMERVPWSRPTGSTPPGAWRAVATPMTIGSIPGAACTGISKNLICREGDRAYRDPVGGHAGRGCSQPHFRRGRVGALAPPSTWRSLASRSGLPKGSYMIRSCHGAMKRLSPILRHAKSSRDEAGLDDFQRPLNGRGRKAGGAWGS